VRTLVSIAGLDPSGGAGVAVDARVAWHHGFHPCLVATALTAQGEEGVTWWEPLPVDTVVAQLRSVLLSGPVTAIKIGMVGSAELVAPLCETLRRCTRNALVLDPVLRASAGQSLFRGEVADLEPLVRLADVVTPNLHETEELLGHAVQTLPEMRQAARELRERYAKAVLITGGHLPGDPVDVLFDGTQLYDFAGERVDVAHVRGTGCALSTALACELGDDRSLPEAVSAAKAYLTQRLTQAYSLGGRHRFLP
jgi:hydroxymethylpyrimidine/phosphomethylpyrimidine kinase